MNMTVMTNRVQKIGFSSCENTKHYGGCRKKKGLQRNRTLSEQKNTG